MTRFQKDIFNRHYVLVNKILKTYLPRHPLPEGEDIEDFKQKIYLKILEKCCDENFDSGRLTDGFIKQSTYYAIMSVYGNYNLASCRNDILNNAFDIENMNIIISPDYDDMVAKIMLKDTLKKVLDTLTPREAKVLKLRFGLDDGKSRTLEEVGIEFNVSRVAIRMNEAKALRKLRHPSRSHKLKDYLCE